LCARDNGCAVQAAEVGFVALNNGAANVMGKASGQTNPGEAEGSIVRASHLRDFFEQVASRVSPQVETESQ
jgi:hypothetical protein